MEACTNHPSLIRSKQWKSQEILGVWIEDEVLQRPDLRPIDKFAYCYLMATMKHGKRGRSVQDILASINMSMRQMRQCTKRLIAASLITRLQDGEWHITRLHELEYDPISIREKNPLAEHIRAVRNEMLRRHKAMYASLVDRDGEICRYCGNTPMERRQLCIDHIFPVSQGGDNALTNLQLLCEPCNLRKSNYIEDWPA